MGVSTAGACSDTFTVVGPSFSPGHTLCGTLTGQHCNSIWMENFKKYIYLTTFYTSICWKCSCHNYHKIDIYYWNNYDHSNLECKSISNRMLFQNEVLLLWNLCMCMWGWFAMSGSLDQFKHVIYNLFGSVLQKPHFSLIHSGVFWAFILESLFWKFNLLLVAF